VEWRALFTDHAKIPDYSMSSTPAIYLGFSPSIEEPVRQRISYALRVFAAVYNYRMVEGSSARADISVQYGHGAIGLPGSLQVSIAARYSIRKPGSERRKVSKRVYAGEDFYLFYGVDETSGCPDWLGEIFEWISSASELEILARDAVGRIPYAETIFGRDGISPRKPYASQLMAWMENALLRGNGVEALPKAASPVVGVEHLVVSSHDVDFYHVSRASTLKRLLKNLLISLRLYRGSAFFRSNIKMLVELFSGKRVGDYLPRLTKEIAERGFCSTFFVVSQKNHRRDPNYALQDLSKRLHEAERIGFAAELHGSYRSIVEDGTLAREAEVLAKTIGKRPVGNRQHWLRFDHHRKLFEAVESAGMSFDSTLGFSDTVGFRNGASFAFPPYDFANERPHQFLELPLVLMDGGLESAVSKSGRSAQDIADEVLRESRRYGWGGMAVLWHDPLEATSVSDEINRVFWDSAAKRRDFAEEWVSAEQFLQFSLERYHDAGLLKDVRTDA